MADETNREELIDEPLVMQKREIIPANYYEATIISAGLIKNNFYNPEEDAEFKKQQLQIDMEVEHKGNKVQLRHWTSLAISSKSNLFKLLTVIGIDPASAPLPSELVGKSLKINVLKEKKEGEDINKVAGGQYDEVGSVDIEDVTLEK